jgi:hypothetical protein
MWGRSLDEVDSIPYWRGVARKRVHAGVDKSNDLARRIPGSIRE